jgi:hypothetical protein
MSAPTSIQLCAAVRLRTEKTARDGMICAIRRSEADGYRTACVRARASAGGRRLALATNPRDDDMRL